MLETIAERVVVAALAAWFAATLAYQIFMRRLGPSVSRLDRFHALPTFRFYAATLRHFRLVYRDQRLDGTLGAWHDALPLRLPWYVAAWNPHAVVSDVVSALVERLVAQLEAASDRVEAIQTRFVYRTLRDYVLALPRSPDTKARQFKIIERARGGSAGELFASRLYSLSRRQPHDA